MRVLVVEDETAIADAVARGLRAEGFVVDLAHTGVDGLWMAREFDYDLLLVDILLPGLSGTALARELRRDGSAVPILVLTAKDGEHDEADALDVGADDFLSKPFSFVVLLARMRALLRRSGGSREPVLAVGDLRLDPATRRCWRGSVEVTLTSREFALAEYLVRERGRVLSRGTIADHVWGMELDADSNIVEVYISYLRRKLDKPFGRADIETVRGAGYRFRVDEGGAA